MSCSRCGGYYSCHCDLLRMEEELRIKKMEVELLQFKIDARRKEVESPSTDSNSIKSCDKCKRVDKSWCDKASANRYKNCTGFVA